MSKRKLIPGWIGVDLDGTMAHYDKWRGYDYIGAPIKLMVERVRNWLKMGLEVRIFTARVAGNRDKDQHIWIATLAIQNWLVAECDLPRLRVTCEKDFEMIALWDDRCVQVMLNTGKLAVYSADPPLEVTDFANPND